VIYIIIRNEDIVPIPNTYIYIYIRYDCIVILIIIIIIIISKDGYRKCFKKSM